MFHVCFNIGDPELPGNYGLWDQVEAFKWINKYISGKGKEADFMDIIEERKGGNWSMRNNYKMGRMGLLKRFVTNPFSWNSHCQNTS